MLFTFVMFVVLAAPVWVLTGWFVSRSRPAPRDRLRAPDHVAPPTEGGEATRFRKDDHGRWMRADGVT